MLISLIRYELIIALLICWSGVVRAASHFRTPWLRYATSIPAWAALTLLAGAVTNRDEIAGQFGALRPLKIFFDVLSAGQEREVQFTAVALPGAALVILVLGLTNRTAADGTRKPRARRWPWAIVGGVPILLVALVWIEMSWVERSLLQDLAECKQRSDRAFAEFESSRPEVAQGDDAAPQYLTIWKLLQGEPKSEHGVTGLIVTIDWYGANVAPLSNAEQTAARQLIEAGRAPQCRSRSRPLDPDEATVYHGVHSRAFDILLRRAATTNDDAMFRESVVALRRFLTHQLREPSLRGAAELLGGEIHYLSLIGEIAARAPERLSAFTSADIADDDAVSICAPIDAEARLIEAEHAAEIAKGLDPTFAFEEHELFRFDDGPTPHARFGAPSTWYVREALRLDRTAKLSAAAAAYRARATKLSAFIAATNALGRPDWKVWQANLAVTDPKSQLIVRDEQLLRVLMSRAAERYQVLALRRLAHGAIAVAQFGRRRGRLPKSWDDVVPEFLPAKPIDPMTGEPLGWENEKDGVLLYSGNGSGEENGGLAYLRREPQFNVVTTSCIRIRRGP